jgi:hypothetical protein
MNASSEYTRRVQCRLQSFLRGNSCFHLIRFLRLLTISRSLQSPDRCHSQRLRSSRCTQCFGTWPSCTAKLPRSVFPNSNPQVAISARRLAAFDPNVSGFAPARAKTRASRRLSKPGLLQLVVTLYLAVAVVNLPSCTRVFTSAAADAQVSGTRPSSAA